MAESFTVLLVGYIFAGAFCATIGGPAAEGRGKGWLILSFFFGLSVELISCSTFFFFCLFGLGAYFH